MFVKLSDHWGRETGHNDRFQWYAYMSSTLQLDNHHNYLFPRFMSDLYSKGQEPVPNITGSRCPHSVLALGLISCLIEKAILLFPYHQSLLISCHSFQKIIWTLLGLAWSWKCSSPIILLGNMIWIPSMCVRGFTAILLTCPLSLLGFEHEQRHSQIGLPGVDLLAVLICFVSAASLSIN